MRHPNNNNATTNISIDYTNTNLIIKQGWIAGQYEEMSIKVQPGLLSTSIDNSNTFNKSLSWSEAGKVYSATVFKNGNILLHTNDNKNYLTNINLSSIVEKTVYEADGVTPYAIHTPVNPDYPGNYFYSTKCMSTTKETDIFCWINYCNVRRGAAPVGIFYTPDFGVTLKVAFKFGQNPIYKDNGSQSGSSSGTILGDASNPVLTRHGHGIEYNPKADEWLAFTGDTIWTWTDPDTNEIHWITGKYDEVTDTWSNVNPVNFGFNIPQTHRLKATECFFRGDYVYWSADATNVPIDNTENGVWRCLYATKDDINTHEKLFSLPNYDDVITTLDVDPNTGYIVGAFASQNSNPINNIFIAKDYGAGEVQFHTLPQAYNLIRLNSINKEGYFRFDTDLYTTFNSATLFIKAGHDLFNNI